MKEQVEQLIDKLADKTLSFGCKIAKDWNRDNQPSHYIVTCFSGNRADVVGWDGMHQSSVPSLEMDDSAKILGHPIRIGDVLERMESGTRWSHNVRLEDGRLKLAADLLLTPWGKCGFTKSLQEISEESGWEKGEEFDCYCRQWHNDICPGCKANKNCEQLKSPQARELFEFLIKIFNT